MLYIYIICLKNYLIMLIMVPIMLVLMKSLINYAQNYAS